MLGLAMLPVHLYEVGHVFVTWEVGIPHTNYVLLCPSPSPYPNLF